MHKAIRNVRGMQGLREITVAKYHQHKGTGRKTILKTSYNGAVILLFSCVKTDDGYYNGQIELTKLKDNFNGIPNCKNSSNSSKITSEINQWFHAYS